MSKYPAFKFSGSKKIEENAARDVCPQKCLFIQHDFEKISEDGATGQNLH